MKVKTSTIVRTATLVLTIINCGLSLANKAILPITNEDLEKSISFIAMTAAALVNWWKNNSYTDAAIEADILMHKLKKGDD